MTAYFQCVCYGCSWGSRPMLADAVFPELCPKCGLAEHLRMLVRYVAPQPARNANGV